MFEEKVMPAVSIRGYAKHRGVSHTAVEKAVKQGRIRTNPDGKIDVEQADREWNRNSSPVNAPKLPARAASTEAPLTGPSYAQSRAVREAYEARLAKLEYEQRTGKVINADEMRVAAFNLSRMIRDRLLNVPDRVVGAVLAELRAAFAALGIDAGLLKGLDMSKVHGILLAETRNILEEFANELAQR